jgi:hypothetical protein
MATSLATLAPFVTEAIGLNWAFRLNATSQKSRKAAEG